MLAKVIPLKQICEDIIYENQYTLEAWYRTNNVDELYSKIFSTDNEFKNAILKIVKSRI